METVLDLLDALDHAEPVLRAGERTYDGSRFVKTVYKTGNYLRHCGVHADSVVEVVPVAEPETLFGIGGTALLEGQVSFEVGSTADPAARLGPTATLDRTGIPPGCTVIGFGTLPDEPAWAYFEREIWSENPFFPEVEIDPERPFLHGPTGTISFAALLRTASQLAADLDPDDSVAVRAPMDTPGVFCAGVLAPLLAGATVLFPDADQVGSVAVTTQDAPESRIIDPRNFVSE